MCQIKIINILLFLNYILRRSSVENPSSDGTRFGCRIFNIRFMADRIEKIRSNKWGESNRICDIRSDRMHMSNSHTLVFVTPTKLTPAEALHTPGRYGFRYYIRPSLQRRMSLGVTWWIFSRPRFHISDWLWSFSGTFSLS